MSLADTTSSKMEDNFPAAELREERGIFFNTLTRGGA